jgi:hypothetical protein
VSRAIAPELNVWLGALAVLPDQVAVMREELEALRQRVEELSRPRPARVDNLDLLTTADLLARFPAVKPRTLRYWLERASPRKVRVAGEVRMIPGNGLGPAIIRQGRSILIDAKLFREWLEAHRGAR